MQIYPECTDSVAAPHNRSPVIFVSVLNLCHQWPVNCVSVL